MANPSSDFKLTFHRQRSESSSSSFQLAFCTFSHILVHRRKYPTDMTTFACAKSHRVGFVLLLTHQHAMPNTQSKRYASCKKTQAIKPGLQPRRASPHPLSLSLRLLPNIWSISICILGGERHLTVHDYDITQLPSPNLPLPVCEAHISCSVSLVDLLRLLVPAPSILCPLSTELYAVYGKHRTLYIRILTSLGS